MKPADKVMRSTAIFTGNQLEPIDGAVAIRENRIIAVGSVEELEEYIDIDTQVIDCGDRLIMPGLNDSHVHLLMGSIQSDEDLCLHLLDCANEAECVNRVEKFASEHPENEWIFGWGWMWQSWDPAVEPTRASLDALGIDRPICLNDASMHIAWLNSKALELIGLSEDETYTDDPDVVTDEQGVMTGVVNELYSTKALAAALNLSNDELSGVIGKLIPKLNALGITSVSDMYPLLVSCDNAYESYRKAVEEDGGTLRITFFPSAEEVDEARCYARDFASDYVRFGGVKYVLDGCVEGSTAYMHEPYINNADPNFVSRPQTTCEHLNEMAEAADRAGFPFRVHAIGDAAATMAIDAMERAEVKNGKKGLRNCLEHTDNIKLEDIDRMVKLGISAAVQPAHSIVGGLSEGCFDAMIGKERNAHMWRYRDQLNHGLVLGLGTDWPCAADVNPFVNIYGAVARSMVDGTPREGFFRENAMSLGEALQAYTRGSAYVEGFEGCVGTLAEGKMADITVLDCNPFEIDIMDLKDMKAVMTLFDGEVVYQDVEEMPLGSSAEA